MLCSGKGRPVAAYGQTASTAQHVWKCRRDLEPGIPTPNRSLSKQFSHQYEGRGRGSNNYFQKSVNKKEKS